jgi:hypothetical protein
MVDYKKAREAGLQLLGEPWTPAVQLVSELRALATDALPIKGYGQLDVACIALGLALQQHATDDYSRGYRDGKAAVLLEAEFPIGALVDVYRRHSEEAAS